MQQSKPIRVFYSRLTGKFYATKHYKINAKGQVLVTGKKYDVTDDVANIITQFQIEFVPEVNNVQPTA